MSTAPGAYQPFPSLVGWAADFDASAVDRYAALFAESREASSPEAMAAAVQVATRYAAVDTGAIEGLYQTNRGFTRTIAEQTATWQAALEQRGEGVARSIQDALNGYEMVLDLATGAQPVTQAWIRRLHEVICASHETYEVFTAVGPQRQPLPRGVYKSQPNNPTNVDTGRLFHYAPPSDTPAEMSRLVEQLGSNEFAAAHPVRQAAYAHYAFVRVHPFADGNGRVARALASAYLYRAPGVPLVVFADQKDAYLDALEAADAGRAERSAAFVAERAIDTIGMVRDSLRFAAAPSAYEALDSLRRDSAGRAGHSMAEFDAMSVRVLDLISARWREVFDETAVHEVVRWRDWDLSPRSGPPPEGYRWVREGSIDMVVETSGPSGVSLVCAMAVWPARGGTDGPDLLATATATDLTLPVALREVHPQVSTALRIRIDGWVDAVIGATLDQLASKAAAELR